MESRAIGILLVQLLLLILLFAPSCHSNVLSSATSAKPDAPKNIDAEAVESKPVIPEPAEPKPVIPEPVEPKLVIPEPVEPKPVIPKPVEPKPVTPKPVVSKPIIPEPVEPKSLIPEPVEQKPIISKPVEPKPVTPKPVEPKPVTPKPVEPKPIIPEPVESKPVIPDPVESKPVTSEPVKLKPDVPKPVVPKLVAPKPVESKPVIAEPVKPKPVIPEPVELKPVTPKSVEPKPVTPKPVEPKPIILEPVESKPVIPDSVESKPVTSEPVKLKPDVPKPVVPKLVTPKPVESKPVIAEPVKPKPVIPEPVELKPVTPKPVESKPIIPEPVEPKSVIPEPINSKSGAPTFTTDERRAEENPYPFQLLMSPDPCSDEDLVIIVHSAVQYYDRRSLLRGTWLNRQIMERALSMKIKIAFVTGMTLNDTILNRIQYEQEMFGDIIQSDFIDDYVNNTYKAISFLRWVSSTGGCPYASLILKIDDDALLHPVKFPKLKSIITTALNSSARNVYLGRLLTHQVNRYTTSKWYISYELWPHEAYPVWFQGLAYMLTPCLADQLQRIALNTKYMFTDDVYIGILANKAYGVRTIIENMLGYDTEKIEDLERGFLETGRVFIHVPYLEQFAKWYSTENSLVRFDPVEMPEWPESMEDLGVVKKILLSYEMT